MKMEALEPFLARVGLSVSLVLTACGDDDDTAGGVTDGTTGGVTDGTTGGVTDGTTGVTTEQTTGTTTETDTTAGRAEIRVVHAAPTAPVVDVWLEGGNAPVITNLAYGQVSPFLELDEGDYVFEIRPAGASMAETPIHRTEMLTLAADTSVTAVAAGIAGGDPDQAFRVLPLVDEFGAAPTDQAVVRIVHAGSDAPTVAIDIGNDGIMEIPLVERFESTAAAGVPLPAGEALQVGLWSGAERLTAFTTPQLPAGAELFLIATGLLSDLPREQTGFALLAIGPTGSIGFIRQNPFVHTLHVSPDAPNVDVCEGGSLLAADVAFGELSRFQVPPGAYTIDVFATPSDDCSGTAASSQDTGTLMAGQMYLVAATGELMPENGEPSFDLITLLEDFTLDDPQAVVKVAHLASAPAVDVGIVGEDGMIDAESILVQDLVWPQQSAELMVAAADYVVGVAAAGGMPPLDPLATFPVSTTEGSRMWVIAAGDLTPDMGEQIFRLLVLDTTEQPWTTMSIATE